jgi:hypothetical protein
MIEICKGILIGNSFLYQGQILAVEGKKHGRPNLSKEKKKKKKWWMHTFADKMLYFVNSFFVLVSSCCCIIKVVQLFKELRGGLRGMK